MLTAGDEDKGIECTEEERANVVMKSFRSSASDGDNTSAEKEAVGSEALTAARPGPAADVAATRPNTADVTSHIGVAADETFCD